MSSPSTQIPLTALSSRSEPALPEGVLVAWYGDDFTGAAATMEVLAFAGLPAMLFLEPPSKERLAQYPGLRGVGVASTARTQPPAAMRAQLPEVFTRLADLKPGLLHYKTCSTLDSSPEVGSIGCAIEIGADLTGSRVVPALVAAPQMRRYQAFGHLFAAHGEKVHRLDRHPVMSCHPVTPMAESDVARHIALQSDRIDGATLTLEALSNTRSLCSYETNESDRISVVSLDCLDRTSEADAGRILWDGRDTNAFVVGSQGVEYALVRHWQETGNLAAVKTPESIGRAAGMVSVSGSVSPTTADQIAWSRENGFACIGFDAVAACAGGDALAAEESRLVELAVAAVEGGRDPLIHTAEGPGDPAVVRLRTAVADAQADMNMVNQGIGEALGRVLRTVLARTGLRRAVISGGDTSGHATRQLSVFALSVLAPTIPGASIFRAHADGPMDGLELALKGGQMGSADYFGWVRDGGGPR
ncbi:four-carbon acid sugar kinase family protein [uncultured Roseovarius sp.]|uniref:four-carbon acid sugar kinase family protein n=1 Tax=uncultured Roseovarius sp. TaxID=293344 RepID=UPI00260DCD17|nr:four-carbon acid sugar kinase family protein [uncultured Roseovarius sp.]